MLVNCLGQNLEVGQLVLYLTAQSGNIYQKQGVITEFKFKDDFFYTKLTNGVWDKKDIIKITPVITSWSKLKPNGYTRELSSIDYLFPITNKTIEQIKEEELQ